MSSDFDFDHVVGDHLPARCDCRCPACSRGEHLKCFNSCDDGLERLFDADSHPIDEESADPSYFEPYGTSERGDSEPVLEWVTRFA